MSTPNPTFCLCYTPLITIIIKHSQGLIIITGYPLMMPLKAKKWIFKWFNVLLNHLAITRVFC